MLLFRIKADGRDLAFEEPKILRLHGVPTFSPMLSCESKNGAVGDKRRMTGAHFVAGEISVSEKVKPEQDPLYKGGIIRRAE